MYGLRGVHRRFDHQEALAHEGAFQQRISLVTAVLRRLEVDVDDDDEDEDAGHPHDDDDDQDVPGSLGT